MVLVALTPIANPQREHLLDRMMIAASAYVSIPFAKEYSIWIIDAAQKWGINPCLLMALYITESELNHRAVGPVGRDGHRYKGIAQVPEMMPARDSIEKGARILREKMRESRTEAEAVSKYKGYCGKINWKVKEVLNLRKRLEERI